MTDAGPVSLFDPPSGYAGWLATLKTRIHNAQQKATQAVNRELVLLYWQIGCEILESQANEGWGAKVIDRLAHDLRNAFPEMKGFRHVISNTCGPSLKHGQTFNLCKRCLHNYRGTTSSRF